MLNLLEEFGFTTAWHLTDFANLDSILNLGILSRNDVVNHGIDFVRVGYDPIVETRAQWKKYVLTFVNPYNNFVLGRVQWHEKQRDNIEGLCLIEIDLAAALLSTNDSALISNGLLSKIHHANPTTHPLSQFASVLNWHVMLDPTAEKSETNQFFLGSEILLPNTVPTSAIRRIWFGSEIQLTNFGFKNSAIEGRDGSSLLRHGKRLPAPAVHNFSLSKTYTAVPILHKEFGRGVIVGQLGDRAVIDFEEKFGRQLVRFGSYEWI